MIFSATCREWVRLLGQIDHAATAFANPFQQPVAPDLRADFLIREATFFKNIFPLGRPNIVRRDFKEGSLAVKEFVRIALRGNQPLNRRAQFVVSVAGVIEEELSLPRLVEFRGGEKNGVNLLL